MDDHGENDVDGCEAGWRAAPMSNLYARLVKGEDERTEALADLLERVLSRDRERSTAEFLEFVSGALLGRARDQAGKSKLLQAMSGSAAGLSIVTQYRIPDGTIPDMVIFNGGEPVCAVEVKIDAAFQEGQLKRYGDWLKTQAGDRFSPALVLLTEFTQAPEDFWDGGIECYGVALRNVASWQDVADWFAALGRRDDDIDNPLRMLAREFAEFLKEDAVPTLDDVAVARNYLAHSHRKLTQAVENMQGGYEFPAGWSKGRGVGIGPVGIWKYHYPEEDHNTRYVYCGICFKPADENDLTLHGYARYENAGGRQPKPRIITDGFHAFVCIDATSYDCRRVPGFDKNRWFDWGADGLVTSKDHPNAESTGWYHFSSEQGSRGGYARIRPLQDLLADDGRIGTELGNWTERACQRQFVCGRRFSHRAWDLRTRVRRSDVLEREGVG